MTGMVTQIYTAPVKLINPKAFGSAPPLPISQGADGQAGDDPTRNLAVLKEQAQKGVISINSVLSDFQNTMNALGVTDDVRDTVKPYLQVIAHQAQKSQPVTGLMKQNLRGAAQTLDEFITKTLGQKSNVVREWVDALLLQPIEYKSEGAISLDNPDSQENASKFFAEKSDPDASLADMPQSFQQTLADARQAVKDNNPEEAISLYQQVLDSDSAKSQPHVTGRVQYLMGRCLEKTGNAEAALTCYQKAEGALKDQPQWMVRVQKSMAATLNRQGDLQGAAKYYESVLNFANQENNDKLTTSTLNQLGIIRFRQGQLKDANNLLQQALEKNKSNPTPVTMDILSNLGAVSRKAGRYSEAFGYYKQALQLSQTFGDNPAQQDIMQKVAALYLDTGKAEKAFKLLQQAKA